MDKPDNFRINLNNVFIVEPAYCDTHCRITNVARLCSIISNIQSLLGRETLSSFAGFPVFLDYGDISVIWKPG